MMKNKKVLQKQKSVKLKQLNKVMINKLNMKLKIIQ